MAKRKEIYNAAGYEVPRILPRWVAILCPSKSAAIDPYKVDIPKEWSKHIHGPWTSLTSPNTELPIQGWKIHVTATLDNAQSILDAVRLIHRGV